MSIIVCRTINSDVIDLNSLAKNRNQVLTFSKCNINIITKNLIIDRYRLKQHDVRYLFRLK